MGLPTTLPELQPQLLLNLSMLSHCFLSLHASEKKQNVKVSVRLLCGFCLQNTLGLLVVQLSSMSASLFSVFPSLIVWVYSYMAITNYGWGAVGF